MNWTTDEECDEFIRQMKARGAQIMEDFTAEELRLIPPLSKPGKAKRRIGNPLLEDGDLALIVASLHPNAPPFLASFASVHRVSLDDRIAKAIEEGSADFWEAVAVFTRRAGKVFGEPETAAHLAVYALRAKKSLHAREGNLPTKGEVAQLVIAMRRDVGLKAPCITSKKEWGDVFRFAKLGYLPQDRPGRVKARK